MHRPVYLAPKSDYRTTLGSEQVLAPAVDSHCWRQTLRQRLESRAFTWTVLRLEAGGTEGRLRDWEEEDVKATSAQERPTHVSLHQHTGQPSALHPTQRLWDVGFLWEEVALAKTALLLLWSPWSN